MLKDRKIFRIELLWAVLIFFTVIVFSQVAYFQFLSFDDDLYISQNPNIQQGINAQSIAWAWRADLTYPDPHVDYWQPLTLISRLLDVSLWGMNASKHHLVNLFFHLMNVLLLFAFLRRLGPSADAAFWTALLFAVHPVQAETVSWVTARKDLLAAFFFFLCANVYVYWRSHEPKRLWYWLCWFLFLLCLLSKPGFLFVPLLLIVIDCYICGFRFSAKWFRFQLLTKAAFILPSVFAFVVARRYAHFESSLSDYRIVLTNSLTSFYEQFVKIFFPADLGLYRSLSAYSGHSFSAIALSAIFIAGLTLILFRLRRKRPYLLYGWLWFVAALAISTPLRFPADRFLYIPLIGVAYALVCALTEGVNPLSPGRLGVAVRAVLASLLLVCGLLTTAQLRHWRNDVTFFSRALELAPDNYVAMGSLGSYYYRRGDIDRAIDYYHRALATNPKDSLGHLLLANALKTQGRDAEAALAFANAVALNPDFEASEARLGYLIGENQA